VPAALVVGTMALALPVALQVLVLRIFRTTAGAATAAILPLAPAILAPPAVAAAEARCTVNKLDFKSHPKKLVPDSPPMPAF
jgi:hypothetical protein